MDLSCLYDLSFFYADHLVILDANEVLRPRMRGLLWVLVLHVGVVFQERVVLLFLYFLGVFALLD